MYSKKNVDYIVVGFGIAGVSFCNQLELQNKTFVVFDEGVGSTSKSGGIFNPTILKRFTAAWNASEFYPFAVQFYLSLSAKLKINIFQDTSILRILHSPEEQNNWTVASGKQSLQEYLVTDPVSNTNVNILAPFGLGKVVGSAKIHKDKLLQVYREFLVSYGNLKSENFEYSTLKIEADHVEYKDIVAKKIVFCEGPKVLLNPFFPKHAIIPNKGEFLIIHAPELKLEMLLKGPVYIIPLGDDLYKAGATYNRDDFSENTTSKAREQILSKVERMIKCSFEVVGQTAGVRPTTRDRKPLLGNNIDSPQVTFFNGLGTHGLLMAPFLSKVLYDYLEKGTPIPQEMDIKRVY